MSGSANQRYAYLMNGCQVIYELPAASRRTLAWGTTGDEAVHWQMKNWHVTVRIQHGERDSQGHVLSTIIGGIRRGFFKPADSDTQPEHVTRAAQPQRKLDGGTRCN